MVHKPTRLFSECISDYAIRDALMQCASHIRGSVLDLGCGERRYQAWFGAQTSRWIGVDWPAPGDARAPYADVYGDSLALPLAAGIFDTVLCTQVLEHVPEPLELLREAARVLRPGGRLVLTAPQYNGLHEEPRDFYRYTSYGLEHLARKAGLEVEQVQPIGGFLTLFAFIGTLHFAPLRVKPIGGLWKWTAWKLDRVFYRPKDCLGYVMVARKGS
jgi:SAM-dependent methyltransferase